MLVQLTVTTCTNFAGRLSLKMLGKQKAEGKRRRKIILVTEVSCRKCQSAAGSQQSDSELSRTPCFLQCLVQRAGQVLDSTFVIRRPSFISALQDVQFIGDVNGRQHGKAQ